MKVSNSNYYNYNKQLQFTGYKSVFSKKLQLVVAKGEADEYENTFLIGQLQKFLALKMTAKRKIGSGFHGSVYKIDDKYVLKSSNCEPLIDEVLTILPKPKFSALKTYYGEPVAEYNSLEILNNVSSKGKHIPAGVPLSYFNYHSIEQCQKYYENEYLPLFSSLPQRSFDAIAKDCDTLNKMGSQGKNYSFDYINPNNFVLVGKSLRITDSINRLSAANPNKVSDLLQVFLNQVAFNTEAIYSKDALPYRRELLKKIILAGQKYNLPLGESSIGKNIWRDVTDYLCRSKEYYLNIIDTLSKFQEEIPDTKLRLKKTSEYLDGIYTSKEIFSFG